MEGAALSAPKMFRTRQRVSLQQSLVKIGSGEWECVPNKFETRLPVFSQDNFYNVEPDEDVWVIQQL